MKINKLFHWLYAVLMLLPVFAVGTTSLYAIFNKNAKDSYYGTTINEELRTQLTQNDTLNNSTLYYLDTSFLDYDYTSDYACNIYVSNLSLVNNGTLASDEITKFTDNDIVRLYLSNNNHNYRQLSVYKVSSSNSAGEWLMAINLYSRYCTLSFIIDSVRPSDTYSFDNSWLYTVEYNKYSFVSEAFYYSLEQLKENSVFNWASTSFLVQPFQYIVNLFGMNTNNVIVLLLSYWLDISIIWLVFDVLMYVPLLIHRWLDKGVIS